MTDEAQPSPARVPLSATEEAYVALVIAVHANAVAVAASERDARLQVLLTEKGVPAGVSANVEGRVGDDPAHLVFTL